MTPPSWLYWPEPEPSTTQLVSAAYSGGGSNQTVNSTNIIGTSLWDGRGFSQIFFVTSQNRIDMYFANDTDRDTALAAYTTWTWVNVDTGESNVPTSVGTESSSRISWTGNINIIDGNTYRLEGS